MAPEAAPTTSQPGGIVLHKNFDVKSLPILTQRDLTENGNLRLANFFSDLKKTPNDDKEARRACHGELIRLAQCYTYYYRQFVREHQRTGITRQQYREERPVVLPDGTERFLKKEAFRWRLKEFLKAMGAASESHVRLPDGVIPVLRLANDQLVNAGAAFEMNSGQALMVLAAIRDFPKFGYVRLHDLLNDRMRDDDFLYKGLWECPTRRHIRTLLEQVPRPLKVALAEGNQALYDSFGLTRARSYGDLNHVWAGDTFFLNDFRFMDEDDPKKLYTPAVSYLIECSGRCVATHDVHLEPPNSLRGLKLIRQGILPKPQDEQHIHLIHGKPDSLLCDNSVPLGTNEVKSALRRLDIEPLRIKPGRPAMNARAERFGGSAKRLIRKFVRRALIEAFPEFDYKNKRRPLSWTQLDQFKRVVAKAIFHYHHRRHRGLGCTPAEALGKALEKTPFKEMDAETVIRLTSVSGRGVVQKEGIEIDEKFFYCDEILQFVGRSVPFIFDPLGKKPEVKIYQGTEIVCVAPLAGSGQDTELREALKGSTKDLTLAMSTMAKSLLAAHKLTRKPGRISSAEVYNIQGQYPELKIPMTLPALPDLYGRLAAVDVPWRQNILVDTKALRAMETFAKELAGKNAIGAFEARHGNGKTFLSQVLVARKGQLDIKGDVLRIEVKDTMDTKALLRRLFAETDQPRAVADITEALYALKTRLAKTGVSLLIIDNAEELSKDTLRILGELTKPEILAVSRSLPGSQIEFPIEMSPLPPSAPLAILLTAADLRPDQIKELREFNWHSAHPLPHLAFEEMAALLKSFDSRFAVMVEAAEVGEGEELKFLKAFYGLTEGAFRRFENILTRIVPLLNDGATPSLDALSDVLDRYAADNYRGSPQSTKDPVVAVLPS